MRPAEGSSAHAPDVESKFHAPQPAPQLCMQAAYEGALLVEVALKSTRAQSLMAPIGIWKSRLTFAALAPLFVTLRVSTAAGAEDVGESLGRRWW
jgi:hypothetical protein